MQIERLYLKGFKPFLKNNVEEVDYKPDSHFQIIIGTNGSGKTSLLREASPLPGHHKHFAKGGMKEFICIKDGNRFRLVSDFTNGNEHFFYINDGPNLNEGKKITAQLQLVSEHFNGYDKDLHELIISEEHCRFTNMSTAERRKWFTRLNTSDMTYALRFYSDIKNKIRDTNGAIQHLKKRLTEEQNRFNELENIDGLDGVIGNLKTEIVSLLEIKDSNNRFTAPEAYHRLQEGLQRSLIKSHELKKINLSFFQNVITRFNLNNINELKQLHDRVTVNVNVLENTFQLHLKELEGMGRNLDSIKNARQGEIQILMEQKDNLVNIINEHKKHLKRFSTLSVNNQFYRHSLNSVIPALRNIIMEFNVEDDDDFSKQAVIDLRNKVEAIQKYINELSLSLHTLQIRKKHIQETHSVNCPKCKHSFKPGVEDEELQSIQTNIVKHETRIEELQEQYQELSVKFLRSEEFLKTWRSYKAVVDSNEEHELLWNELNNLKIKVYVKTASLPILSDWEDDLYVASMIDNFQNELTVIENLLDSDKNVSGEVYDEFITRRANELEKEIQIINEQIHSEKELLQSLHRCSIINDRIESIKVDLNKIYQDFINDSKTYASSVSNDYINQRLVVLNKELVELESKLQEKEKFSNTINLIKGDLNSLERKHNGLKTIVNELSPTDGLIAEYLSDNIGRIIENMNNVIEDVWTYRLSILPCGIESGDLDYEFPFLVKEDDEPIDDIKEGSTAQKEMINFTFKIVAMWFLGLENYPLYLDELGASFDYQHRTRILDLVKNLIYKQEFSQMFYISQYASTHDSFSSADICVTDQSNVVLPEHFNTCISFK